MSLIRIFFFAAAIHFAHALNFKQFANSFSYKTWYNHKHPSEHSPNDTPGRSIDVSVFEKFLVNDSDGYCFSNLVKRSINDFPDSYATFIAAIIVLLAESLNQNNLEYVRLDSQNSVFNTIIVRNMNSADGQGFILPLFLNATLRPSNVRTGGREPIPLSVQSYLRDYCDKLPTDHNGHLLAGCLGGPSDVQFNYSPQTARLNTNSGWTRQEREMREFLRRDGTGRRRIEWQLIVLYGPSSTRPIGFALAHQNYNENGQLVNNANQPISRPLPLMVFSNDVDSSCILELKRHLIK